MLCKDKKSRKLHTPQTFLLESIRVSLKDNCGALLMLGGLPTRFLELVSWKA